ncbi:MAG TPA: hypothetical protein VGV89_08260 [Thermoplasmata archaeon]|nr:hypothetical protein [Thermoplasmata archaeon]
MNLRYGAPIYWTAVVGVFAVRFTLMMIGVFIYAGTNYGILLTDEGILYYDWGIDPRYVFQRQLSWDETGTLFIPSTKADAGALFWVGCRAFTFDPEQTAAVLRDSRGPL